MNWEKKLPRWGTALLAAGLLLVLLALLLRPKGRSVTVGFIYDNDETTPYSYNFYLAQQELQSRFPGRVKTVMDSNVLEKDIKKSVERLVDKGCSVIFTNNYGDLRSLAEEYPQVQLCQVSGSVQPEEAPPENYHTFKGEIYQGRYASGVAAGLKLEEMIQEGRLRPEEALVGYVAAYPYPEVISGFTAFLLGVRSVVPQATMRVKFTNVWSSYILERTCARELLEEGCVVLSQHTDTVGPAVACEDYYAREVCYVGYNTDMSDIAPHAALLSTRINWTPYVTGAVQAVLEGKRIEDVVEGREHPGNDMSGGFDQGWVELTEPNPDLMPPGAAERLEAVVSGLRAGTRPVFEGDYRGVNPEDPNDTVDLREEYQENRNSSVPSFHYLLEDLVQVEE